MAEMLREELVRQVWTKRMVKYHVPDGVEIEGYGKPNWIFIIDGMRVTPPEAAKHGFGGVTVINQSDEYVRLEDG